MLFFWQKKVDLHRKGVIIVELYSNTEPEMATELRVVPNTDISQTRFAGGKERGTMLQLTVNNQNSFQHNSITRQEARALAQELMLFAEGSEISEE